VNPSIKGKSSAEIRTFDAQGGWNHRLGKQSAGTLEKSERNWMNTGQMFQRLQWEQSNGGPATGPPNDPPPGNHGLTRLSGPGFNLGQSPSSRRRRSRILLARQRMAQLYQGMRTESARKHRHGCFGPDGPTTKPCNGNHRLYKDVADKVEMAMDRNQAGPNSATDAANPQRGTWLLGNSRVSRTSIVGPMFRKSRQSHNDRDSLRDKVNGR